MKKQVLAEILGQRASTGEENARFLYELQLSVLAALKECGSLTELQFSYGADMLERLLFMVAFGNCRRPAAQCLSHQNGNEFSRVCHIGGKTGDRILFRPVSREMVLKSTDVSYSLNFLL